MLDLIVRNGWIIDGTGAPRFAGDVAVQDDTIDADHRERRRVGVDAELAEVRPHALPGAACRDAEALVVVAVRSPGGERIPQPEAVLGGDPVGDVRERGRALVGSHHEIRILLVVHDEATRVDEASLHPVVG